MSKQDLLNTFLFLNPYDYVSSEKMLGFSVQLLLEITEYIESGYSKNEIQKMIDNMKKPHELNFDEFDDLKRDGYSMLDIRYGIYLENSKKRKKHLF